MSIAINAATAHRSSLFATVIAAVMEAFGALHDAQWRAPWNDDHRWAVCR